MSRYLGLETNVKPFYQHSSAEHLYVQWLTTEWDNMAAVFMNKLPCDCFLHDLLDLWDMETQQSQQNAYSVMNQSKHCSTAYLMHSHDWSYEYILSHKYKLSKLRKPLCNKYQEGERVYEVSRKTADRDSRLLRGKGEI